MTLTTMKAGNNEKPANSEVVDERKYYIEVI